MAAPIDQPASRSADSVGGDAIRAAAASGVFSLINGPVLPGRVVGAFGQSVIIAVDTPNGPRVVSLLGRAASGVPNGVRLTVSSLAPVPVDAPALIGGGGIQVGDLHVRVVRSWDSLVRPAPLDRTKLAVIEDAARSAGIGVPAAAVERLAAALRSEPQPGPSTTSAAMSLLGLGAGLTPGGDDVLAGLLAGWCATGRPEPARSLGASLLANVAGRTTTLSADLLRLAVRGHACVEALGVLRALTAPPTGVPSTDRLRQALRRLLSVGHTSGADLATGLALGLRHAMTAANAATEQLVAQEVG